MPDHAVNMAFLGRHTTYLQRLGVETIHAPFFPDIGTFLRERGKEFEYRVIAANKAGEGEPSNAVMAVL